MFYQIGGKYAVNEKKIIGFFDIEETTKSEETKEFLKSAQREKRIINISIGALPKTFIVTDKNVYITPLEADTIINRNRMRGIEKWMV